MRNHIEQRAMLARMEAALAETERHLATVERQITKRAERLTVTSQAKSRQDRHKRSGSMWTRTDERIFLENFAAIRFERRGEIDALSRKLARQADAITVFRHRHRINEDAESWCHDTAISSNRSSDPRRSTGTAFGKRNP